MNLEIIYALVAAILFGISTPFAKLLVGEVPPVMLAGLLYSGSGLGLSAWLMLRNIRRGKDPIAHLTRQDIPWLAGAVLVGGIVAPVLLMLGITLIPASSAALLLNLEGVFTALMAWFVFRENFDRRIFLGMVFIIVAGVLLSWQEGQGNALPWGGMFVVSACFCWGIDNNLTRKVSASDPIQIAAIKGGVAGIVNIIIALTVGATLPGLSIAVQAAAVGLAGYGVSLVLFVLALRHLGTARTGAYFSVAPFFGVAVSLLLLHESPSPLFWLAVALMGAGIWLHVTEHHEHEHTHEKMAHIHAHIHDEHHRHEHDFLWDGQEPHMHFHQHTRLTHKHSHYPDIYHQHSHT